MRDSDYIDVKNYSCMFEISRLSAARQLGQPMHSQSANFGKFELNSRNLAGIVLYDSVQHLTPTPWPTDRPRPTNGQTLAAEHLSSFDLENKARTAKNARLGRKYCSCSGCGCKFGDIKLHVICWTWELKSLVFYSGFDPCSKLSVLWNINLQLLYT